MFTIPGRLVAFATLPGILFHEIAHWLACLLCGVRVLEFRYNTFEDANGSIVGYVVHERSAVWWKSAVIGAAPLFFNVPLTLLLLLALGMPSAVWTYPAYYFAFCLAFHALPSAIDNRSVLESAVPAAKRGNPVAAAFVALGYAVRFYLFLRRVIPNFIADMLYAAALGAAAYFLRRALVDSPFFGAALAALAAAAALGVVALVWSRRALTPAPRSLARHAAVYCLMSAGVCVAMMSVPFVNALTGGEHVFLGAVVTAALMGGLMWAEASFKPAA